MVDVSKDKLVVVKHNELIRAAQSLTLIENQILLACIAQINSKGMLNQTDKFSIHVKELETLIDSKELDYSNLKSAAERLYERSVVFTQPSNKLKTMETKIRWVYSVTYFPNEGALVHK